MILVSLLFIRPTKNKNWVAETNATKNLLLMVLYLQKHCPKIMEKEKEKVLSEHYFQGSGADSHSALYYLDRINKTEKLKT